uniref:Olfactory receptor n=1 Tax=Pelodiscus sinensis TaxID=13735 RepID=K7EYT6_PELSI
MHSLPGTQEGRNQTSIVEFFLLGFGNLPTLQVPLFLLFLVVYLVTMAGNLLIVLLVVADRHLHTPMYFFLGNLSCLETCYSSTILPRLLASLLTGDRTISWKGCFLQLYCFGVLACAECNLLMVMSFDRYLAICKPFHYVSLTSGRFCLQLAAGSWMSGLVAASIIIPRLSMSTFCGPNGIDHFMCEFNVVIKLSCSDTHSLVIMAFLLSSLFMLPPFLLTMTSYVTIITTILRIPSTSGRQKAFSTCSSHLLVVAIYYGSLVMVYLLPDTSTLGGMSKVFSVFYTIFTPLVNPLIYSLRNKDVQEALSKLVRKLGCREFKNFAR